MLFMSESPLPFNPQRANPFSICENGLPTEGPSRFLGKSVIEECELAFKAIEMDITSNAFLTGVITEEGIWQQD